MLRIQYSITEMVQEESSTIVIQFYITQKNKPTTLLRC
ncbi:hypothetical protein QFZ51_005082 [Chitinophaga sp. W3I9]